jgi:hypothetical protein
MSVLSSYFVYLYYLTRTFFLGEEFYRAKSLEICLDAQFLDIEVDVLTDTREIGLGIISRRRVVYLYELYLKSDYTSRLYPGDVFYVGISDESIPHADIATIVKKTHPFNRMASIRRLFMVRQKYLR